jgi:hypothetical protein
MSNWCENSLTITGEQLEIDRFVKFAKTKGCALDSNKFIPYPDKYKLLDKKYAIFQKQFEKMKEATGFDKMTEKEKNIWIQRNIDPAKYYARDGYNQGGYEWCKENWGTKGNMADVEVDVHALPKGKKQVFYSFNTAWSPPVPVIKKMGEMFPSLTFTFSYAEDGEGYKGELEISDGIVVNEV